MPKGQVKWFDPKKGYGFIIGPEGQDVFAHYSHIQSEGFKALKDGEWVEYELLQGEKGWQARSVHQIEQEESRSFGGETPAPGGSAGYEGGYSAPEPPVSRGYEGADD